MILCHSHRFVFVKGYKVASTSVEMVLGSLCDEADVITPLVIGEEIVRKKLRFRGPQNYAHDKQHEALFFRRIDHATPAIFGQQFDFPMRYHDHMPLSRILDRCQEALDYTVIAITRNPYEKAVSWVKWLFNYRNREMGQPDKPLSLETLRLLIDSRIRGNSITECNNVKLYTDNRNKNLRLLRFENLQDDFNDLMSEYGKTPVQLPLLKQSHSFKGISALEILTPQQKKAVEELFQNEFEKFGYEKA